MANGESEKEIKNRNEQGNKEEKQKQERKRREGLKKMKRGRCNLDSRDKSASSLSQHGEDSINRSASRGEGRGNGSISKLHNSRVHLLLLKHRRG